MNKNILDLKGHKYGRLLVLEYYDTTKSVRWLCQCDCGEKVVIQANNLRSGHTKSCGCFQDENKRRHSITHGETYSKTYHIWSSMKARCLNPRSEAYQYYGARGIGICEKWLKFSGFLEDMGHVPNGLQIDRIDNDGHYCKENCRWTTKSNNMRNNRNTRFIVYENQKMPLISLSEKFNIPYHALRRRILYWGMRAEEAVSDCKHLRKRGINKRNG